MAHGACRHCGRTARFGARWHTPRLTGTRRTHHPALAIGRTPRTLAAGSHPPCHPRCRTRHRMVRREGRNVPACAHLFVRLAPTINWCQQYSTLCVHAPPLFIQDDPNRSTPPQATPGGPRLPHALPVNPGQPRSAPCAPSRPRPTMARTHLLPPFSGARAPITHHYRQPHTMNATKNGNHAPAATSGHAGPFTLAHPRCRDALFRSVPPPWPPSAPWYRTRKGPPPCGSGPCCIMHRAGVSPARSRAGARPARQGR